MKWGVDRWPDAVPTGIPDTLDEALTFLREYPTAHVVAGGTDIMPSLNGGVGVPPAGWLSLRRVASLGLIEPHEDGGLHIGAGVTFSDLLRSHEVPSILRQASRTVGSPQIRNAGTVGGNLATASPAGDSLPPLLCCGASVHLTSVAGSRSVSLQSFLKGPKQPELAEGEVITEVHLPHITGRQVFAKVGPRNAMVIAVCSLAARFDVHVNEAAIAIGSVAPTARLVPDAATVLLEGGSREEFAEAVVAAAAPIDDVRASAAYRRHALAVLARRAFDWLQEPA